MEMKIIVCMLSIAALASCSGGAKAPAGELSPADGLRALLADCAAQGRVMYGHQDDLAYGHDWSYEAGRSDIREVCGSYPAVCGWDLGKIECDSARNLDGIPFDYMRERIIEHHARGGVTTVSWHPFNPAGGDAWTVGERVVETLLPGGARHEALLHYLDRVADFMLSLRDADGNAVPVIFRPWHEHTGSWFWWGKQWCTPEEYRALWRMTRERMDSRGVDNLVWAYSPGSEGDAEEYMERFPGTDYVDLLGLDIYQNGADGLQQYAELLDRKLAELTALGESAGLPVALTETGLESLPVTDWWTGVLWPVIEKYPICYVLTWRNAWDRENHFYAPYPGQLSADDFADFASLPRVALLDDM